MSNWWNDDPVPAPGEPLRPPGPPVLPAPPVPPGRRARRWPWLTGAGAAALIVAAAVVILVSVRDGATPAGDARRSDRDDDVRPVDARATRNGERVVGCEVAEPPRIELLGIELDPMSRQQERDLGEEYATEVLSWYHVADDDRTQETLDELLDELAPRIDAIDWSVTLLDSTEINAFALPGGPLYFTTAITDLMSTDELAFVMGHEIAHVECRHIAQQLEREALAVAAVDSVFGGALDAEALYESELGQGVAVLASLSFSRDDESEADLRALDLLDRSGRPTSSAADALRVLRDHTGDVPDDGVSTYFSTHPPTRDRIAAVEAAE